MGDGNFLITASFKAAYAAVNNPRQQAPDQNYFKAAYAAVNDVVNEIVNIVDFKAAYAAVN